MSEEMKVWELMTVDYVEENDIEGDSDVIDRVTEEYSGDVSLERAIFEVADGETPIYYNDIWEQGQKVSFWIDQAMKEGLTEGEESIDRLIQQGICHYHEQVMMSNVENIIINYMIMQVNEQLKALEEDDENDEGLNETDAEELREEIVTFANETDLSVTYSEMDKRVTELLKEYKLF